jgi:hypothetical protein
MSLVQSTLNVLLRLAVKVAISWVLEGGLSILLKSLNFLLNPLLHLWIPNKAGL